MSSHMWTFGPELVELFRKDLEMWPSWSRCDFARGSVSLRAGSRASKVQARITGSLFLLPSNLDVALSCYFSSTMSVCSSHLFSVFTQNLITKPEWLWSWSQGNPFSKWSFLSSRSSVCWSVKPDLPSLLLYYITHHNIFWTARTWNVLWNSVAWDRERWLRHRASYIANL